jgi:hypothetical protein
MARTMAKTMRNRERGMALLLTLFALLLLSAIGLFMVMSSNTETRIDANYGSSLRAYYAARSGLEEVRDRIKYPSSSPGGLADLLPQDVAGNPGGVLYVLNPSPGETVDPAELTSAYFDDDLCHDYNSGTPKGIKCTAVPAIQNWQLPAQAALAPVSGQLGYKWIRINIKTNRTAAPYFVDQTGTSVPLDTRVCWDGQAEQLSPGGSCDANGMQTVYMLTALAAPAQAAGPSAARKLLQAEVVAPSIRPAGVLTAASLNLTSSSGGIPPVAVDGRVHKLDGTLAVGGSCSAISALGTDNGSSQLEQSLNQMRKSIVDTANLSCNADGTSMGSNICTPGLWWVRGTDSNTRFVTSLSTLGSGSSGDSGNSGHDGGDHHGSGGGSSIPCDSTTLSCYTYLNLGAPQLFGVSATTAPHVPAVGLPVNATAPFVGNSGNQLDGAIYQPGAAQTIGNQVAVVNNLVAASLNQANYFTASSTTLAGNYGSSTNPAVVVFTDPTLSLQNGASLTGYGVLVVPNALEISNGTLRWNGIVLINSSSGHVTVNSGANGSINGALLLAPGAVFNLANSASTAPSFRISYSCEAIDLAFSMLPFKVISTAETSF